MHVLSSVNETKPQNNKFKKIKKNPYTEKVQKNAIYKTKHNMRIFVVNPLSSYKTTRKQQLNGEQWDVELRHLSGFDWAMLFSCPVLGRMFNIHDWMYFA